MIRPSSLPMLARCPKFNGENRDPGSLRSVVEVSGDRAFADAGTLRHTALSEYLSGNEAAIFTLPEDQQDGVIWAADYIKLKAPMNDDPLVFEKTLHTTLPNGDQLTGTPDVVCGPHIFDLKWRYRDYGQQMAAYALMTLVAGHAEVSTHLLFADQQRSVVLRFDSETAWASIRPVIEAAKDPAAIPTPCEYCGWCRERMVCPAMIERLNSVIEGRPDWHLGQYHASEIKSPQEMGKALDIARCLGDWCESVEHHAKEMAVKLGLVPFGYKLQDRRGNRFITDVSEAYVRAGIPQAEFLKACVVKPKALFDAYAVLNGMKVKAAEREVETKLGEIIQRKQSTVSLVSTNSKTL